MRGHTAGHGTKPRGQTFSAWARSVAVCVVLLGIGWIVMGDPPVTPATQDRSIKGSDDIPVAVFRETGSLVLKGTLSTEAASISTDGLSDYWSVKVEDVAVALIETDSGNLGNMTITGTVQQSEEYTLDPGSYRQQSTATLGVIPAPPGFSYPHASLGPLAGLLSAQMA